MLQHYRIGPLEPDCDLSVAGSKVAADVWTDGTYGVGRRQADDLSVVAGHMPSICTSNHAPRCVKVSLFSSLVIAVAGFSRPAAR